MSSADSDQAQDVEIKPHTKESFELALVEDSYNQAVTAVRDVFVPFISSLRSQGEDITMDQMQKLPKEQMEQVVLDLTKRWAELMEEKYDRDEPLEDTTYRAVLHQYTEEESNSPFYEWLIKAREGVVGETCTESQGDNVDGEIQCERERYRD